MASRDLAYRIPSRVTREFGRRLSACRLAAGYRFAEDFAKVLGVLPARYRMYERGDREPPLELLLIMAKRLDKSVDFLLGFDR